MRRKIYFGGTINFVYHTKRQHLKGTFRQVGEIGRTFVNALSGNQDFLTFPKHVLGPHWDKKK